MPPRISLLTARKAVPVLRPSYLSRPAFATPLRANSTGPKKDADSSARGPTQDPLPHASEEAAQMDKIMSGKRCDAEPSTPELDQGTPVSEILQRDEKAKKHMPKVMQDQIKNPSGSRSFSTSARAGQDIQQNNIPDSDAVSDEQSAALVANMISDVTEQVTELQGLKYPAPESLPSTENHRERYDAVLNTFTHLLMSDGKLARAQRNMATILDYLRTSPAPQPNPRRRLIGGPPAPQLPLDPVLYLNVAIDSVAPLVKLVNYKGIAGGGKALPVPAPLSQKHRRRLAMRWIIDASDKRRDSKFANRVAQEIVAVAEGRSGAWDRRDLLHKSGTAARANSATLEQKRMFKR